ncbi:MAG: hypothetical protein GX790_01770 [Syntrophomonadaceae bacterium]|nr:hypothetical protein [Syntrophomonadaceae bacterium]
MSTDQIWATVPWSTSASNTAKTNTVTNNQGIMGKDDFLKILITELKYQDPLNPLDSKDSIAQMATFSSLEQMQNLNKSFESMGNVITNQLMPSIMLQQASNMIGKEVAYLNPELTEDTPEDEVVLIGQVSSIAMIDGKPFYVIGKHKVELSDILEIGPTPDPNQTALAKIIERLDDLLETLKPEEGEMGAE